MTLFSREMNDTASEHSTADEFGGDFIWICCHFLFGVRASWLVCGLSQRRR